MRVFPFSLFSLSWSPEKDYCIIKGLVKLKIAFLTDKVADITGGL